MEPLSPEEVRVVACMVEKQLATPDYYPMTHNAVVTACNQVSNRDPVVAYDDDTVRLTLNALRAKGLARAVHLHGARVPKFRHVLDEALELDRPALALLSVLCLRGPQTPGELRTRSERLFDFGSRTAVEQALQALAGREAPLVRRLEQRPGRKEARFVHLLGEVEERVGEPAGAPGPGPPRPGGPGMSPERLGLEARVAALEAQVEELRKALGLDVG